MKVRRTAAWVLALSVIPLAGACGSSATKVTCDEFAAQSFKEQGETLSDLLDAHDLERHSMGNTIGVQKAVLNYCGLGSSAIAGGKASRNNSKSIDNAADWSSSQW